MCALQAANRLRESDVEAVLKSIPVKAGAGKMTVRFQLRTAIT